MNERSMVILGGIAAAGVAFYLWTQKLETESRVYYNEDLLEKPSKAAAGNGPRKGDCFTYTAPYGGQKTVCHDPDYIPVPRTWASPFPTWSPSSATRAIGG